MRPESQSGGNILGRRFPLAKFLFLAMGGCSNLFHPNALETVNVRGRVHDDDQPIVQGWIEFWPIQGTVGNLRSAPIAADGTFEATNVAVGHVRVRLVQPSLGSNRDQELDDRFIQLQTFDSPLRLTIPPNPKGWLDIDLSSGHSQ